RRSAGLHDGVVAGIGRLPPAVRGRGAAGSAQPCQGWGRGFESRRPLHHRCGPDVITTSGPHRFSPPSRPVRAPPRRAPPGRCSMAVMALRSPVTVTPAQADEAGTLATLAAATFPLACPPTVDPADIAAFAATELSAERFTAHLAAPDTAVLLARS